MVKREGLAIPEWSSIPLLRDVGFNALVEEHRALSDAIDKAESRKKELAQEIEPYLMAAGVKSVKVGALVATQCNGAGASKIDAHLLIEEGVSADVISKCTVPGKEYTYVQVKRGKEKA